MKKRLLSLIAMLVIVALCASCAQPEPNEGSSDPVSTTTSTTAGSKEDNTTNTTKGDGDNMTTKDSTSSQNTTTTGKQPSSADKTTKETTGSSTTKSTTKSTTSTTKKATTTQKYHTDKYDMATCLVPIWEGNTVYNETIMFVPKKSNGDVDPAPLMYKPTKILEVRSYDLKTVYKEGVDYTLTSDGCIKRTANSSIPVWKYDDYYTKDPGQHSIRSISQNNRYLKYGEGDTFCGKQVCVTYTHNDSWDGPVQEYAPNTLKKTIQKLQAGDPLTIVYNGDSIAEGCNSSAFVNMFPYMPIWTKMVTSALMAEYDSFIIQKNTAVGGQISTWAKNNVDTLMANHNPDLVVLNFGMNDGSQNMQPSVYKSNIQGIIDGVRKKRPNCEFILISNCVPNPDAKGWTGTHKQLPATLDQIASSNEGVVVVKMYEMQQYMLTKKRYWDTTGNNINHPSDFFVRLYAQMVCQTLIPDLSK